MKQEYRNAVDRIVLTDAEKTKLYHRVRRAANPEPNNRKGKLTLIAAAALSLILVFAITVNSIPVAAAIARPSYPSAGGTAVSTADGGYLEALRRFSYDTAGKIDRGADGNTVYSPYGMSVILSMLAECTSGGTQDEILSVFQMDSAAQLSAETASLYKTLYRDSEDDLCRAVQSVWIDSSVSYHESVLNTLAQNEYAHSFSMSFENGRAASAVSDWFADNMRSKRRVSVPFVPENRLMFASGFEYRSEWNETFVKEQTYEGVFRGTMVTGECIYMNKVAAAVPYLQTEEATASLIGLANGGSLVLILPQEETGLDGVLSDGALLQNIVSGTLHASKMSVEFSVPKVSFEETIDISSLFRQMGIASVFDETKADFSVLSSDKNIFAGQIAESASMDLNETGETSAGTQAYGASSGAVHSLTLDRPFCFVVVSENEIPLMIGAVENAMQLAE